MEALKIRPQVKVEELEGLDPTFEAGSVHTATARLTNPTAKEFTYTTELYLGVTKVATSGVGAPFAIPAGGSVDVNYTVTMPLAEGEHEVYLDVWVGTELLAHYKATENIIITISPAIEVGPIIWV